MIKECIKKTKKYPKLKFSSQIVMNFLSYIVFMLVVNQELSTALSGVKHEQEYMQVRSTSLLKGSVRKKKEEASD